MAPCRTPRAPVVSGAEWRRVSRPSPAGLDPDQLDPGVADEAAKVPIAFEPPPTQARTRSGSRPAASQHLGARLLAEPALKVAHQRRVGGRPHRGADHVVGRRHIGTQSRIAADTASFSVRAPASTPTTSAPSRCHPLDVRPLAAHVLRAHVHHALETEQGTRRGRGDPVLARAGLGDHPRLAHPPRQQRLAQRVVDLVRAGVGQVLALQPHLAAGDLRQAARVVERRRPADVVAQQPRQLVLERRVGARREPLPLQLVKGRDQRLGHVAAAVGAEAPRERRGAHTPRRGRPLRPRGRRPSASPGPCARAPPRCRWRCPRAKGRAAAIASPTLSGSRPPESTTGGSPAMFARELPGEGLAGAARRRGE